MVYDILFPLPCLPDEGRLPKCGEVGVEEIERWASCGTISMAPVGGDSPPDTDMALVMDVTDVLCVRDPAAASDCSGELDIFSWALQRTDVIKVIPVCMSII